MTIATNMAGRGTDIQLGGNLEMQIKKLEIENAKKFSSEDSTAFVNGVLDSIYKTL